jgi:hypothetical protein
MTSEEALIGMRGRVRESLLSPDLRGKVGTIKGRWGSPDYVALDVLLDDGRTQLFWHHQLEEVKEAGKLRRSVYGTVGKSNGQWA